MREEDLVTIAVLQTTTEANLVKNQLAAAGIKAYLAGEEAVAMAWHMATAFGGIKVQVAAADMNDALALLERRRWQDKPEENKTAIATAEMLETMWEDDEPEEVVSEREKNANRAIRAAVFGLILLGGISIADLGHDHGLGRAIFFFVFLGLEGYALLLLFRVYFSKERLAGGPRTNAKAATLVTGTVLVGFVAIVVMAFHGPIRSQVDLRKFAHPEVLVGTWEGTYRGEKGETRFSIDLKRNGTLHYQEDNPGEIECTGTWAYENWTLYVRYDHFLKGDSPWKGQIVNSPVEDFKESSMTLVTGEEKIGLARRP